MKIGKTPNCCVWECSRCGAVNAWAYQDLEKVERLNHVKCFISHGSCFDNICGACGANHVKRNSPILSECYTH